MTLMDLYHICMLHTVDDDGDCLLEFHPARNPGDCAVVPLGCDGTAPVLTVSESEEFGLVAFYHTSPEHSEPVECIWVEDDYGRYAVVCPREGVVRVPEYAIVGR